MTALFLWSTIILLVAGNAWTLNRQRTQRRKLRKLRRSLLDAHQKMHAWEDVHARDKAAWEQTEEKLRSYLKLMDTLMNTIPTPIYVKDADGVYQGCNKVFAKQVLGLTRDRIIGRRPQDLTVQIPADLAAVYQREEIKMRDKAGFHAFEAIVQCADGRRREFLFNLAPIVDGQDKPDGCVAVLSDLTEKNQAVQDRLHKERLEGVLETAGAVCHEFNQPLQALSGYTELLAMKLEGKETLAYIQKMTAQFERMRDITDKLQGITRYEVKDYTDKTKIIDIHKSSDSKTFSGG
jgi:PAS domain S-box-containing protein